MRVLAVCACAVGLTFLLASCEGSREVLQTSAASSPSDLKASPGRKPSQEASAGGRKKFFPKSEPARDGKRYPFDLSSCWLPNWIDFDHHYWALVGELRLNRFHFREMVPFGIKGSIRLLSPRRAVFWQGSEEVQLRRAPEPHLSFSDSCF
jgi:hypothetical protein